MSVMQEVTNCVVIKNQSQYSLTNLEPPPCELLNDVGINQLGHPLQEIRVFPTSSPIIEQTLLQGSKFNGSMKQSIT